MCTVTGVVDRFTSELSGSETIYYVHVVDCPHFFSGGSDLSPKLRMIEKGDRVVIGFIQSDEDVLSMASFDMPELVLRQTINQEQLGKKVAERVEQSKDRREASDLRGEVQNMSNSELRELMKLKKDPGK